MLLRLEPWADGSSYDINTPLTFRQRCLRFHQARVKKGYCTGNAMAEAKPPSLWEGPGTPWYGNGRLWKPSALAISRLLESP